MKFNKNGEKPQVQKKHNFRFDENGHIIVQNPSAYWLPNIRQSRRLEERSTPLSRNL